MTSLTSNQLFLVVWSHQKRSYSTACPTPELPQVSRSRCSQTDSVKPTAGWQRSMIDGHCVWLLIQLFDLIQFSHQIFNLKPFPRQLTAVSSRSIWCLSSKDISGRKCSAMEMRPWSYASPAVAENNCSLGDRLGQIIRHLGVMIYITQQIISSQHLSTTKLIIKLKNRGERPRFPAF